MQGILAGIVIMPLWIIAILIGYFDPLFALGLGFFAVLAFTFCRAAKRTDVSPHKAYVAAWFSSAVAAAISLYMVFMVCIPRCKDDGDYFLVLVLVAAGAIAGYIVSFVIRAFEAAKG